MAARTGAQNQSVVLSSLKSCATQLEAVARRTKVNKEGLSPQEIKEWSEKIIQLIKDNAVARKKHEVTMEAVDTIIGNKRRREGEENQPDLKTQVDEAIREKCSKFDVNSDSYVKNIVTLLTPSNRRQSDEFEVIDEGFRAGDTICPYTRMVFQEAMKRYAFVALKRCFGDVCFQ